MTEAPLGRKDREANQTSPKHNPLDVAAISVLAAAVVFLLSKEAIPQFDAVLPAFLGTAVLIAAVVWLLGRFYRQEAEIELLQLRALEIATRSKAKDRSITRDEKAFLER